MKRIVRVPISFALLIELMTKGFKNSGSIECTEGLPDGAVYVRSYTDEEKKTGYLVFEHESFEPVEEGAWIPELRVTLTKHS
jgi:hypothetical protein